MGLLDSLKSTFTSTGERRPFRPQQASPPAKASSMPRQRRARQSERGSRRDDRLGHAWPGLWHRAHYRQFIYAPANGRIGATTVTNHSIGMITRTVFACSSMLAWAPWK